MTNEKNGQKWRRSAIFRPDTTRSRWPIEISLRKTKTFSFFLRGDLSRYIPESSFTPFSFRLHRSQPKKTIILSSFQHDLSELCVRYSMCCYPAFTVPWNGGGKRSFLSLVPYRHRRDFLKREKYIFIKKEGGYVKRIVPSLVRLPWMAVADWASVCLSWWLDWRTAWWKSEAADWRRLDSTAAGQHVRSPSQTNPVAPPWKDTTTRK